MWIHSAEKCATRTVAVFLKYLSQSLNLDVKSFKAPQGNSCIWKDTLNLLLRKLHKKRDHKHCVRERVESSMLFGSCERSEGVRFWRSLNNSAIPRFPRRTFLYIKTLPCPTSTLSLIASTRDRSGCCMRNCSTISNQDDRGRCYTIKVTKIRIRNLIACCNNF